MRNPTAPLPTVLPADALRSQAESRLQAGSAGDSAFPAAPGADATHLLHELQVHQIELELQNEELQKSRDAAEEAAARYADLYDFAPVGYLTLDQGGCITRVNLAAAQLLGSERAHVAGKRLGTWVGEAAMPAFNTFLSQSFVPGAQPSCELALLVNSQVISLQVNASVSDDAQECRLVLVDITAKRLAENALRESERRWKFALEGAGAGVWDWNYAAGTAYFSPRWKEMLGAAEDEIGNSAEEWVKRVHPDDLPAVLAALQDHIDGKTTNAVIEHRLLRQDGSWTWVSGQGMVVSWAPDGKPLRIVGTNIDISARKQSEQALRLSASVFTHAREGIMITDAAGSIVEVNDAFTRITGYSHAEVRGQNPRMLQSGHQSEEFYAAMWKELIDKGYWSGEIWNRRKGGEVYAEMQTVSAVLDASGQTQSYVALFSDVTSVKLHQQQLERMAHYDPLTGLPNRLLLADRLHQAILQSQRRGQALAVAFMDLDGFKAVNDQYGHDMGDHLLIALAQRLKLVLREGDTLARLGGDEFVVLLVDLDQSGGFDWVLDRLLHAAAEPLVVDGTTLQVSASIGVAQFPHDGVQAQDLLRHADQAMYQAKLDGRNRWRHFDADVDANGVSVRSDFARL